VTKDFLSNRDLVESLGITDKITRNRVAGYLTRCHNQPSIITPPYRRKKITNSDRRRRKKRSKKGRHKK